MFRVELQFRLVSSRRIPKCFTPLPECGVGSTVHAFVLGVWGASER